MFGFGKSRERDFEAELQAAQPDEEDYIESDADSDLIESRFSDDEYNRIFQALSEEDLRLMSVEDLAGLAALSFAAAEDSVRTYDGVSETAISEIAADYARASALSNFALLKHAGVAFDTNLLADIPSHSGDQ